MTNVSFDSNLPLLIPSSASSSSSSSSSSSLPLKSPRIIPNIFRLKKTTLNKPAIRQEQTEIQKRNYKEPGKPQGCACVERVRDVNSCSLKSPLPTFYLLFRLPGCLLECPGFVSIVINDWTEDEEILRYDLLVACPPEFNFTLTFPCQPLGSSSGPAHLLDRHRSNRRQRKEKLLQTSLKRYHPLQGQKPTYDPMSPKHPLRSQAEWFDHRPETQSQEAEEEYQLEFHLAFEVLLDDGEEIYRKIMTSLAYKTSDNRTTNERKFGGGALHLPGGEPDAIFQFGDDGTLNIYRESRLVIFILGFTIVMFFLSSTRDYYHELRRYNNCDRIIFRFSDPSPCRCVDLLPGLLRRFCPQDLGNTKRLESPSKMNIQIPGDDYRKTDDQADLTTPTMLTDKLNPPRLEIKVFFILALDDSFSRFFVLDLFFVFFYKEYPSATL